MVWDTLVEWLPGYTAFEEKNQTQYRIQFVGKDTIVATRTNNQVTIAGAGTRRFCIKVDVVEVR